MAKDNDFTLPPGLHNLMEDLTSGNFDGVNRRLDIQNGKTPAPAPKKEEVRESVDRRQDSNVPQFALSSGDDAPEDDDLVIPGGDTTGTDTQETPHSGVDNPDSAGENIPEVSAPAIESVDTPPNPEAAGNGEQLAEEGEFTLPAYGTPSISEDESFESTDTGGTTPDDLSSDPETTPEESTDTPGNEDTVAGTTSAGTTDSEDFFKRLLGDGSSGSLFDPVPASAPEPVVEDVSADKGGDEKPARVSDDLAALPTSSVTPEQTDLAPTFTPEEEPASTPASKDEDDEGFIPKIATWVLEHKRTAGIGAAVFALVMVSLLVLSQCGAGDDEAVPSAPVAEQPEDDAEPVVNDGSGDKTDAPLIPTSATANCQSGSTEAQLAFTPDQSKAWVCVRSNGIDGNILTLKFDRPVIVSSANVVGGFNYTEPSGKNLWSEYRHVTKLKWSFSSKERYLQDVAPNPVGSSVKFPNIATQEINVMVMKTESDEGESNPLSGSSGKDAFAISKITLNGRLA